MPSRLGAPRLFISLQEIFPNTCLYIVICITYAMRSVCLIAPNICRVWHRE
jgi:hypothetical protein